MPFKNEHSSRLQDPKKFDPKSFRRNDSPVFGKKLPSGVEVIWGKIRGRGAPKDPVIPQAIRFPIDKYTVTQAKKWLSDNEIKFILFEPAEEVKESVLNEIHDIDKYTPGMSSDDNLKRDLRTVASWYTTLKTKGESKYDEDQLLHLAASIIREMIKREKVFHPENWKDKPMELFLKVFKALDSQGIVVPENVRRFIPNLQESRHSKDHCMLCSKPPGYEVLWAEGIGHAWFCEADLIKWSTEGDGKGDVCSCKKIMNGEAVKKFRDNSNPNIWEELKLKFKIKEQSDKFEQVKPKTEEKKDGQFTLRWHCGMGEEIVEKSLTIDSRFELLIDSNKDSLDRWDFSNKFFGDPFKEEQTHAIQKKVNIQTPNGELFPEWMDWEGSIPAKESELKEVIVVEEKEDSIYIVKDKEGNLIGTKKTLIQFAEGQKAWVDQFENLYTGFKGGTSFGNPNDRIPSYIEIKDTGDVRVVENTDLLKCFEFNGKQLKGFWTLERESSNSDIWIFRKGMPKEELYEKIEIIGHEFDVTSSTFPIEIKFQNSTYSLVSTKNGKLLLNKDGNF